MSRKDQFDWVDFYKEMADKLLQFKENRQELVAKVYEIYDTTGINMPTLEKDNQLIDIDPFTVFGLFNKSSMKESNRVKILAAVAEIFHVAAPVPTSFASIPVLNNQNATFYCFIPDSENEYFFIIDEINRGNLSKIFGELFMLIESDKRGVELELLYSDEKFSVPENVYIIGMMNTADRSLAMMDYALRRRFAFFEMKPGFDTEGFREYRMRLGSDKIG